VITDLFLVTPVGKPMNWTHSSLSAVENAAEKACSLMVNDLAGTLTLNVWDNVIKDLLIVVID